MTGLAGDRIRWELGERRKELTAVQGVARVLHDAHTDIEASLLHVLELLPPAWQYPEITAARIEFGVIARETQSFALCCAQQAECFVTSRGTQGRILVGYTEARSPADEGPFLFEERDLIRCLAQMLRSFCEHHEAEAELHRSNERLEQLVRDRTRRLRLLSSELTLSEERQRRAFARDLHDHLGQALAFLRMQLRELQGETVFSGNESQIASMSSLLEKAIRYTRTLTAEISPPVLYELGIVPALEWLGEELLRKHGLRVCMRASSEFAVPDEATRILLFIATRELLLNVVKHARVEESSLELSCEEDSLRIVVEDDGVGFDPEQQTRGDRFGLFSVVERVQSIGGRIDVRSRPGAGTRVQLEVPRGIETR